MLFASAGEARDHGKDSGLRFELRLATPEAAHRERRHLHALRGGGGLGRCSRRGVRRAERDEQRKQQDRGGAGVHHGPPMRWALRWFTEKNARTPTGVARAGGGWGRVSGPAPPARR